ncbi:hypothetical protein TNCV_4970351 [Trichonephila clavipes]|nr:hypothetical protein TNCV_4970351 [Trichonephila clavipes]
MPSLKDMQCDCCLLAAFRLNITLTGNEEVYCYCGGELDSSEHYHPVKVTITRQKKIACTTLSQPLQLSHFVPNRLKSINLTSKALQSPKIDLENAKTMLNSSLTSIINIRNNFANIKEETILCVVWLKNGISPRSLKKKRHGKVRQFFDDLSADEKLQDRERLFEVDVLKADFDVIDIQLKITLRV